MHRLESDTLITVKTTYILDFKTVQSPYESHYMHYETHVRDTMETLKFSAGDWFIPMEKSTDYFVVSVLDPRGADSYFTWNFFDGILQQKEWYSPYVFEDEEVEILEKNPELKGAFDKKLHSDEDFRNNPRARLYYIYKNSYHFEPSFMRLPVFRF